MATTVLGLSTRTTPQVRTYANVSPTAIGGTFGSAENAGTAGFEAFYVPWHRVVRFGSYNHLYATVATGIYRSTNGGSTWSLVYTWPATNNHPCKSGIYVADIAGVPALCALHHSGFTSHYGVRSFDGTTWTQHGPFTNTGIYGLFAGGSGQGLTASHLYHGTVYAVGISSAVISTITFYNPGAGSGGGYTILSPDRRGGVTLVTFNDRLMMVFRPTVETTSAGVYDVTSGPGVLFAATTGVTFYSMADISPPTPAAFEDGGFLYVFMHGATGQIEAWQISSTGTGGSTPIGGTVLPPSLRAGVGSQASIRSFVDYDSNPVSPTKYLIFAADSTTGTSLSMWQWNGPSSAMTFVDTNGAVDHAIGFTTFPIGSQSYTPGQAAIERTGQTAGIGYEEHSFILYSPSGSQAVTVKVHLGTALDENVPASPTISDPSTGGTVVGDTVTGWIADNTTVRTVRWQAATDGYSPNTRRKLWFEVY